MQKSAFIKIFIQYFLSPQVKFSSLEEQIEKSVLGEKENWRLKEDMNRPFYPNKLSQRRKRGSRRNGKDRGASSSCKGYTYIYRSLFPHTNFAVYSHATGTPITYRALFLIMEERGLIRGRSVRRGEKIEKRFLPIQVRTASYFPLSGEGRDLL